VTDRIVLKNIQVEGRHGVPDEERAMAQPFEVDVELGLDLGAAGATDDLARTIDYSTVDALVREIVGAESFRLLESIAATIAERILAGYPVDDLVVRVRKPAVRLTGPIDYSGVEIRRTRPGRDAAG
jgi:7,8-dihydroneopterin aldolase/epimerase/oxygenase